MREFEKKKANLFLVVCVGSSGSMRSFHLGKKTGVGKRQMWDMPGHVVSPSLGLEGTHYSVEPEVNGFFTPLLSGGLLPHAAGTTQGTS